MLIDRLRSQTQTIQGKLSMTEQQPATLDDLARFKDRAELIGGRIVMLPHLGHKPGMAMGEILMSLHQYIKDTGHGHVYMSKLAYEVPRLVSGRESFSPNASYYDGPLPENRWAFIPGPPTLAIEIRSVDEYGTEADIERAVKRADYFAAGTPVVWDVDARNESVDCYRADAPDQPTTFLRGQVADAEPAVPGWRMAVDDIFAVG